MAGLLTYTTAGKAVNINQLPPEAWTIVSGGDVSGEQAELEKLWRAVPWLNRGVGILSNALVNMPFVILNKAGEEVDSSEDYQNVTGLWADPHRDLWLMEASLNLFGASYWLKEKRGRGRLMQSAGLRYFVPHTIKPKIDASTGLVGFKRSINGREPEMFNVDELLYIWNADPYSESAPNWSRAMAALSAAKVVQNMDAFAAMFFERGAIKTTLLQVEGNPPPEELARVKSIWDRIMRGLKTAYKSMVIKSGAVNPIVIGEGIESLGNTGFSQEKREEIATALGVPHSSLFSNAANYAVKDGDNIDLYDKTVIPDSRVIAAAINEQYLAPAGYRLQFRPEEMAMFQEEEEDRTGSILNLVNSLVNAPSPKLGALAWQVMGVDLPDGMEYSELEAMLAEAAEDRAERAPDMQPSAQEDDMQPAPGTLNENESDPQAKALLSELEAWERWTLKRVEKGKHRSRQFITEHVPADMANLITDLLDEAENAERVREIFAAAMGD